MTRIDWAHWGVLVALLAATPVLSSHRASRVSAPATSIRSAASPGAPRVAPGDMTVGAELVVTANFGRLRELGFGSWWAAKERELTGVGKLSDVCRFDPTLSLRELSVNVPLLGADDLELGFVAAGEFAGAAVADCAGAVVARRGGHPSRGRVGSFTTVADPDHSSWGEIAVRDGGPVLLGRGAYLHDLVEAAEGRLGARDTDRDHKALRSALGPGGAVVISWVPQKDSTRTWLGEAGLDEDALAGLRGAAARVDFASDLVLELVVSCPDAKLCAALEEELRKLGRRVLAPWLELWLGRSPDSAPMERETNRLRFHWRLPADSTAQLFALAATWLGPETSAP
jgi:hypothetical protein